MDRQTAIEVLAAEGIHPTDARDMDAIIRIATFLRQSADRVSDWRPERADDDAR